ncbi:NAD-dependent epimerase/dehydratase family protein [Vibrio splendidus]|uniref:NAD-dependent epimerase/dehydratase family protein n=1 Tax=Vibrio splendidus TaxID=29497 RepID=UPI000C855FC5|nr:NAD-dependent epimerase/dehydratase family protein [Vibrio splendidus]MCQ8870193.1 NAD(P)-dependent oxidoreductase [Vibrio splendidus]PMG52575.1 NAD-dependent dehydratase [Vibrio splendidus]
MKVLIVGTSGYIGHHVTTRFVENGFDVFTYSRSGEVLPYIGRSKGSTSENEKDFDVIINCARPHWSEFSPSEIANVESKLLTQLDRLAVTGATKIHTSGVWLFGNATYDDLKNFRHKPFEAVKLDVRTIENALRNKWHVVYCPSFVYGGENCQLKRLINTLPNRIMQVAVPSQGYNQYVHVEDIAKFYLCLVDNHITEQQHFIAETQGYSPEAFSELLVNAQVLENVSKTNWDTFEANNDSLALDIEKLNLTPPISLLFAPDNDVQQYIKNDIYRKII